MLDTLRADFSRLPELLRARPAEPAPDPPRETVAAPAEPAFAQLGLF
jgi:hypothetical protein